MICPQPEHYFKVVLQTEPTGMNYKLQGILFFSRELVFLILLITICNIN